MARYNRKYREDEQYLTIGWLLVLFALVILFLIWRAHGIV